MIGSRLIEDGRRMLAVQAARAQLRFLNGLSLLLDEEFSQVGRTPRREVLRHGDVTLSRFARPGDPPRRTAPVLLVPPLMVRPYIYDLRPGASLASHLLDAGVDPYLVDFGVPDEDDRGLPLDAYVTDFLPACVEAARRESGADRVFLLGWCKGGIFSALYAAAFAPAPLCGLISIAAPIDMRKLGLLWWSARLAQRQVPAMTERMGNVPGILSSTAFKLMNPVRTATRYADLWVNLWNEEYVRGKAAMTRFLNDFIPYPETAFRQLVTDVVAENKLVRGRLVLGGRRIDLGAIAAPLLCVAGEHDQVVTKAAAKALVKLAGGDDKEFVVIPGGHIGVVVGHHAREQLWPRIARWIIERSP